MPPASVSSFMLSRTLSFIVSSFFLPHRDDPSYTQWDQREKGTCPRLHSKLPAESAKVSTRRPVSYPVPRNKAPGRWLWRKVGVPVPLPRARVMFLCRVLSTVNTGRVLTRFRWTWRSSGLLKVEREEWRGRGCRASALNAPRPPSFSSGTSVLGTILHLLTTISPSHEFPNPGSPFSHR